MASEAQRWAATAGMRGPRFWERAGDGNVIGIAAWVGFFILWELVGRSINPIFLSYPSAVAVSFAKLALAGELHTALANSGRSLVLGFTSAAALGILVGILMGRIRLAEYALDTYVNALYATPTLGLLPLIILWFGVDVEAKAVLVFIGTFFPVLINTYVGARDVSQSLIEVGQAFVASRRQQFSKIILWATFPYVVAGLRLGLGRAVSMMVVAELLLAFSGLGALIRLFSQQFRTDAAFAPIIVLIALAMVLTQALKFFETKLAPWKETERAQE